MRKGVSNEGGGAWGEEGPGLAGELRSWGALAPALAPSWRAGVQQKGRGKEAQAWRENSAPGENYAPASAPASTSRFRTDLGKKRRRASRPGGVEAGSGASLVLRSDARFGAGVGELRPAGRMGVGWAGTPPGPCRTLLQIGELRPRARPRESMRMAELRLCRPQGERPGSSWRHLALRSGKLFAGH